MSVHDCSAKYCVLGAGPSGLAAVKNLRQRGIAVECLEREDSVGGVWNYDRSSGSVYESAHMISSKRMTEYTDFPMPKSFPPFPSHRQALDYLRDYAAHFRLHDAIKFRTEVRRIEPIGDSWLVTTAEGSSRRYKGVVIANGHHSIPLRPEIAGENSFAGQTIHSRDYKTPDVLKGKRVLVVGGGNSGCDIAVEAAQHARETLLSLRRGYHFLPKFLFGRPIDSGGERLHRWRFPLWLIRLLTGAMAKVALGRPETYGLPVPDHRLFETHPIVNSQLLYSVGHGRIRVKPGISHFAADHVNFTDGSSAPIDLVIYATGYRIAFPFLDESLLLDEHGFPNLFLNAFHPKFDNLFVAGLLQPNSGLWCLADYQTQLMAAFIAAQDFVPPLARWFRELKASHVDEDLSGGIRYDRSPRHRIEVEYFHYRERVKQLLAQFGTPVTPCPASTQEEPERLSSAELGAIFSYSTKS